MATPTIDGRGVATDTASPLTVIIPGTKATDDLVVISLGDAGAGAWSLDSGAGWTELADANGLAVYYKKISSSEANPGFAWTGGGRGSYTVWKFAAGTHNDVPEISTQSSGTDDLPDSNSLSPSGGSSDYQFLSVFTQEDGRTGLTAIPSGYDDANDQFLNSGGGGGGVTVGAASKAVTGASSEDPGNWDLNRSAQWYAYTISVEQGAAVFELDVDVGSYVISGKTVDFGIGLPVATGSYVITGKDAELFGHKLYFVFDSSDEAASGTNWAGVGSSFGEFFATDATIEDPNVNELSSGGTSAGWADDPGGTIFSVRFRSRVRVIAYDDLDIEIFTDGKGESLGSQNTGVVGVGWLAWTDLSTPSGGWTWAKLQALEVYVNPTWTSGDGQCDMNGVELEVLYSPNAVETNVYYWDGNAVAAEGADWNNVTNADDGNDATFADELNPDTGNLTVDGTSAPSSNVSIITKVEVRFKGYNDNYTSIDTNFDDRFHVGNPLLIQTETGLNPAAFSNWEELGSPLPGGTYYEGGFNWEKVSNLETSVRGIGPSASGEVRTYIAEVRVTSFTTDGAFILQVDAGSYVITGLAANLVNNRLLVDAGSYVLTGIAADLDVTKRLPVDSGVYVLSGLAVELISGFNLPVDTGSYVLSGIAADLEVTGVLVVDAGSYVITGIAANLVNNRLLVDAGSYVLTGISVDFLVGVKLEVEVGSYAITGLAAGLTAQRYIGAGGEVFVNTFYYDNTPTDPDNNWTSEPNAVDASISTFAVSTFEGSATTNELHFDGNTSDTPFAPLNRGISQVRARTYGRAIGTGTPLLGTLWTNSLNQFVYADVTHVLPAPAWSAYSVLTSAHLNWDWLELEEILVDLWGEDSTGDLTNVISARTELEVTYHNNHYAIYGKAANVFINRLQADAGVYVLTGISADLDKGFGLDVDVGSYVLTGFAADLEVAQVLPIDVGSYIITGIAADLQASADNSIVLDVGSYVITGISAALHKNILFTGVGSYTLTGRDIALSITFQIDCVAGAYVLTGLGADLDKGNVLPGAAGSYTITGIGVDLEQGFVIHNVAGVYNISGISAALDTEPKLSADTGSYAITGVAAALNPSKVRRIYLVG